jgi:glycosyltransferase involved in cell wall biosynthesis
MHVAFTTPATFSDIRGGGERYPLNLARGIARASPGNVEVELLAPAEESSRHPVEAGVWVRGCRTDRRGVSGGAAVSWELIEAVTDADLVHVHQVFTLLGEAAVLAARIARRPVCVTDHGGRESTAGLQLGLLDLADALVAYSRFGAASLGTTRLVTVVEGGVDTRFFSPPPAGTARRHVLFAGRILPHKGVDLLVSACPPGIPLVIAGTPGDPGYLEELRRLAGDRDVTIVLDPPDEQLRDLYRTALAIAAPSVHFDLHGAYWAHPELMGMTMLEGMACGAPAVCLRTAALPEYVDDGVTGFVVDDAAGLAGRLTELAGDAELGHRMGAAATERVRASWDMEVAGRLMLDLYRGLVGG